MTRLGLVVIRLRDGIVWALPLLAVAALVSLLTTLAVVSVTVAGERDDQAETLRQVEALAREAKDASETNRAILEQLRPCDPAAPESPACVRERESQRRVAEALGAIQEQHNDVLAQLAILVGRPSPAPVARQTAPTRPGGSTPTTVRPKTSPATTAAPATTTTCVRNKAGKCRG